MVPRRLPPYARQNADRIKPGRLIWILVGPQAWDQAKRLHALHPHRIQLICPPDDNPLDYDWSVARGHLVILEQAGPATRDQVMRLLKALFRSGARLVREAWTGRDYVGRNLLDA